MGGLKPPIFWLMAKHANQLHHREYQSGLQLPSPGDLPAPGRKTASLVSPPLTGRFFTAEPPGKPLYMSNNHNKLWKILKEMGIPDHLTCVLRNLCAGQEATVRTGHGTTEWFQIGKGVCQGCILSPCLFNLYAEYIMRNSGLEEAQGGIKIARRNLNNLRYADGSTFIAESEEELKRLLMKVKEESEKAGLKLNIQKTKIMASGPITSWQIDGETVETADDFLFLGSKITADGDCSHAIKRHLLLARKVMTKLDSILKSRDITLLTKVHLVKAMVLAVVMYGCESWTIKKAEH